MKLRKAFPLMPLMLLLAVVHAQSRAPELSPCALSCVAQTLPAAGCALKDVACQCRSKALSVLLSGCMIANCTMQESLDLSRSQAVTCGLPFRNKSTLMVIVFAALIVFTSFLVGLRLASKFYIKRQIAAEDYIAGLAQCMSIVSNTFAIEMSRNGFGKHLYSLKDGAMKAIFLKFYIGENIYVFVLGLVKISILAFYLRIFQHERGFRIAVYSTIVFIVLGTTIISLLTIFQCRPVAYFWDKDLEGTCMDISAIAYANSGLSILQDFLIVALPTRVVWMMNLDRKQKWTVAFMFALGSFGCIISMVRLQSVLIFGASIDPSWDYVAVTIWTVIELAVAIICSCLPALRTLIIHIYPKFASFRSSCNASTGSSNSVKSRNLLRAGKRRESTASNGACMMDDVHIECGRLDIKWEGVVSYVEVTTLGVMDRG